jgi:hypothetical protein
MNVTIDHNSARRHYNSDAARAYRARHPR